MLSEIAISDNIFLSNAISFLDIEFIRAEYETPKSLAPAFILAIQRALKDLFLFFLSLNAYCKDLMFDCFAVLYNLLLAP